METCAVMVRALHDRSHPNPSLSAEDCMARQNSPLAWKSVLPRTEQGRCVLQRRDDDGEEDQTHPTD
jgi:hypothetical protein